MRQMRFSISSLLVLGLLGPAGLAPGTLAASDDLPPLPDVPFYRADELRSSIVVGPGPAAEPQLAWERVLDRGVNTDPILVGGLLIVGDQDGHLIALDARTGDETWRATGSGAFAGAPAASAGVIVAADDTSIRAFDATSGAERWHRDIASDAPRIEIVDEVVYVGTVDGGVKGLDLHTGVERWSWQGDDDLSVRVDLVADGVVYANPDDGRLLAIDLSDGSERWRFLSRASRLAYGLADATVFVTNPVSTESGQMVGQIAAIDAATGRVRWRFVPPSGNQVASGPFRDGILYVSSHEDGIFALRDDGDTYSVVWHIDAPTMYRVLTLVGDTLYGAAENGTFLALRADDGAVEWSFSTAGSHVLPIISGGMIFTADPGGSPTVRAFADADLIAKLPLSRIAAQQTPQPIAGLPDPFHVIASTPLAETGVVLSPFDPPRSEGPEGISMAVGPDGLLYVIDPASVVTVIDPVTMQVVRRFGRQGAGDGEFACLCHAIDVGPDGLLYIVDDGNHRVQVVEPDGTFVRQLGSFGSAEGQFVAPFWLTIDEAGAVYVLDGDNGMISKFDPDGAFVWRVGGPSGDAALRTLPHGLAVLEDGTILVTLDPGGPALLLDPDDGSVIGPWGEDVGGSAEPTVDHAGNVLMFQYGPSAMRMFDADGNPLGIIDYEDEVPDPYRFYPTPVFAPDGYGYSFDDTQGLLRLEIALP